MKNLIFLFFITFCNFGFCANKCYQSAKNEITFQVIDKFCDDENLKKKTCVQTLMTITDECKDDESLVRNFCNLNGQPAEKIIKCHCQEGQCLN